MASGNCVTKHNLKGARFKMLRFDKIQDPQQNASGHKSETAVKGLMGIHH